MNSFVVVAFALLAVANAGLIAAPIAEVIQGPSSKTTVVGPDGSQISAIQPGGTVVASPHGAVLSQAAPAAAVHAAPIAVAHSAPIVVAQHTPLVYAAPYSYAHHGVIAL